MRLVRDLVRAREDVRKDLVAARNRMSKFLLRHGRVFRDGKNWTVRHRNWLISQTFEHAAEKATSITTSPRWTTRRRHRCTSRRRSCRSHPAGIRRDRSEAVLAARDRGAFGHGAHHREPGLPAIQPTARADGVPRADTKRALQWRHRATWRHHEDWELSREADSGRGSVALPTSAAGAAPRQQFAPTVVASAPCHSHRYSQQEAPTARQDVSVTSTVSAPDSSRPRCRHPTTVQQ